MQERSGASSGYQRLEPHNFEIPQHQLAPGTKVDLRERVRLCKFEFFLTGSFKTSVAELSLLSLMALQPCQGVLPGRFKLHALLQPHGLSSFGTVCHKKKRRISEQNIRLRVSLCKALKEAMETHCLRSHLPRSLEVALECRHGCHSCF